MKWMRIRNPAKKAPDPGSWCVNDTGGAHWVANISANFRKNWNGIGTLLREAWGKLIHEKKPEVEISWHCPFNILWENKFLSRIQALLVVTSRSASWSLGAKVPQPTGVKIKRRRREKGWRTSFSIYRWRRCPMERTATVSLRYIVISVAIMMFFENDRGSRIYRWKVWTVSYELGFKVSKKV